MLEKMVEKLHIREANQMKKKQVLWTPKYLKGESQHVKYSCFQVVHISKVLSFTVEQCLFVKKTAKWRLFYSCSFYAV